MYQSIENLNIERHFLTLQTRQVHYRIAGKGPPLLVLHQSPTSSAEMASTIEYFANEFTVIAPDTPGFGLSDYIDGMDPNITQYAEAVKEFVDALGLDKLCIYGFHTGAIIGAEMARLYPDLCLAVVVNGLFVEEKDEVDRILEHYIKWYKPTQEGTQMPWIWSRLRDQIIFFPWFSKEKKYRMSLDLPDPELKQPFVMDLMRTSEEAQTAYKAAFLYPAKERIQEMMTPTFLLNYKGDPLGEHPQRLESIPDCVHIELLDNTQAVEERAQEIFLQFSNTTATLSEPKMVNQESGLLKGYAYTSLGPLFYRSEAGDENTQTVIFLHDYAASSNATIEISECLEGRHRKIFIDLPGHGETGSTHLKDYRPQSIATMLAEGLAQLDLESISVVAMGVSSSIAAALSLSKTIQVEQLILIDPWYLDPAEMKSLPERYAPDLIPSTYGEHLLRGWYFVRDSELYFPWYDTKNANALKREADIDPQRIHDRAVDALKAGVGLTLVARDLIGYDIEELLQKITVSTKLYAWQGNGREQFTERVHQTVENSTLEFLPENRLDWLIRL